MDILINLTPLSLPAHSTVADALAQYKAVPPFAVAHNGDFLPRSQYHLTPLNAGDHLEIVQAMAGG